MSCMSAYIAGLSVLIRIYESHEVDLEAARSRGCNNARAKLFGDSSALI